MTAVANELIARYFDAFNRHDLDGVLACCHPDATIVGSDGSRYDGLDAVRAVYLEQFAITPDGVAICARSFSPQPGPRPNRCSRARARVMGG